MSGKLEVALKVISEIAAIANIVARAISDISEVASSFNKDDEE